MGYHVDNRQMTRIEKSQMMMSHQSRSSQLHKRMAQTNRTKQDDVTYKNGNDEQCFRMLQSNSGVHGGPETG